jgi:hypothetical protein
LANTDLQGTLPLVVRGKVRHIYVLPDGCGEAEGSLLIMATDRISAYVIVMENVRPGLLFSKLRFLRISRKKREILKT